MPGDTLFGIKIESLAVPMFVGGQVVNAAATLALYDKLPAPGILSSGESLAYVLKLVVPPAVLWQWLSFESYAIMRITTGNDAVNKVAAAFHSLVKRVVLNRRFCLRLETNPARD